MMHRISGLLLSLLVTLFCSVVAQAQPEPPRESTAGSFELFEALDSATDNRASAANNGRNNSSSNNARNARNTPASPTFTLIGTSRIGTKEVALLKHLSGDVIRVPLSTGINVIPGHELYSVVNHGPGRLALQFPSSVPCSDYPDSGVSCDSSSNISTLSLTTADAIVRIPELELEAVPVDAETEESSEAEEPATRRNPFAAIRDRARAENNNTQATSTSRFQPRRIDPSDVPPGMRVISTPFGDRLVDQ